jgi:hypothetical protein
MWYGYSCLFVCTGGEETNLLSLLLILWSVFLEFIEITTTQKGLPSFYVDRKLKGNSKSLKRYIEALPPLTQEQIDLIGIDTWGYKYFGC